MEAADVAIAHEFELVGDPAGDGARHPLGAEHRPAAPREARDDPLRPLHRQISVEAQDVRTVERILVEWQGRRNGPVVVARAACGAQAATLSGWAPIRPDRAQPKSPFIHRMAVGLKTCDTFANAVGRETPCRCRARCMRSPEQHAPSRPRRAPDHVPNIERSRIRSGAGVHHGRPPWTWPPPGCLCTPPDGIRLGTVRPAPPRRSRSRRTGTARPPARGRTRCRAACRAGRGARPGHAARPGRARLVRSALSPRSAAQPSSRSIVRGSNVALVPHLQEIHRGRRKEIESAVPGPCRRPCRRADRAATGPSTRRPPEGSLIDPLLRRRAARRAGRPPARLLSVQFVLDLGLCIGQRVVDRPCRSAQIPLSSRLSTSWIAP